MNKIKVILQFKGFNYKNLDKIIFNILKKGLLLNIDIKKPVSLPTTNTLFTVLKSPHVNKTAREQFEIKHYRVCLKLKSFIKFSVLKWILLNKSPLLRIKIKIL